MLSPLFALAWVFGLCSALLFLLWHCRNALLARVLPQGGDLIDIELAGDVFLPFDILPQDTAVPEHVIASLPVFLFPGDGDGASSNTLQPSAATPRTKAAASAASAAGGSDPVDACASPAADNATAAQQPQQQQQQQEAMTWVQKLCAQQQSEERAQQQQQRQALADAAKHYTGISLTPQPDQSKAGQPARDGSSDAGSRSSRSSSSSSEDGCSASSSSSSQRGHRAGSSSSSSSSSRSCAARLCRRLPQPQQQQCDVLLQQDMKACRATHQQQQQQHMDGDAGCSSSSSTSTSCDGGGGGGSATLLSSSDSLSCVICCDDYQAADLVKQLPCKHCMHAKCIDAWLRTPRSCGSCPLCKVPVWQPALAVRSSAHGCFILTSSSLERRGVARQVQGEGGVAMAAPPAANVATVQTE